VCHFSTSTGGTPKSSSSNLPFYLGGAGVTGLGAYLFLGGSPAPFSTTTSKPKQKQEKSALDPERFLDLKLKSIEPYNHNTSRFVFELPDGGAALSPITSLVVVRASEGSEHAPVDKKGNLAIRAYTPISSPDQEGELVLLIKKYENGVISKYVHERLRPNDTLAIKGPIVKFPYKGMLRHHPQIHPKNLLLVPFTFSHASRPRRSSVSSFCVGEQRTSLRTWR
jgi:cytochrome-b5 reductase